MTQLRISSSFIKATTAEIVAPLSSISSQTTSPPTQQPVAQSFTSQLLNSASKLVNLPSVIYAQVQPYAFMPNLLMHSTYSVIHSHVSHEWPSSWDIRTSISVALIKSGMEFRGNTSARIKTLQALAITPVPADICISSGEFTYSPEDIFSMEQTSKKARDKTLPDVPRERSQGTTTVKLEFITAKGNLANADRRFIMYLHGGAYFCGSLQTHRSLAYKLAVETGATIVMVSYRLSPEYAFPAALHDAFAAYLYLQNPNHPLFIDSPRSTGAPATEHVKDWIIMGDSAGGGLALSLLVYIKDYLNTGTSVAARMPVSGVLFSPWVDLTCSSASWLSPVNQDYLPTCPPLGYFYDLFDSEKGNPVMWYTAGVGHNIVKAVHGSDVDSGIGLIDDKIDEEEAIKLVTHPLVSPYYANLSNLPPLLIQAGGVELIRDESLELVRMLHKSNPQPSNYRHELYKDMPHVFQTFFWTDASKLAMERAGMWCKGIWEGIEPKEILFDESGLVDCVEGVDRCEESIEEAIDALRITERDVLSNDHLHEFERHPFY